MRHQQNHKYPAQSCSTCIMDEEFDKRHKMERRLVELAKTVQRTERSTAIAQIYDSKEATKEENRKAIASPI